MSFEPVSKDIAIALHTGIFRSDNKTPYIKHPLKIVEFLKSFDITDDRILSIAWLHDTIEENNSDIKSKNDLIAYIKQYLAANELKINFSEFERKILECVEMLTFYLPETEDKYKVFSIIEKNVSKASYLSNIADNACFSAYIVKVADRICNIKDFIESEKKEYAKIYFVRAEILFSRLGFWKHLCSLKKEYNNVNAIEKIANEIEKIWGELK